MKVMLASRNPAKARAVTLALPDAELILHEGDSGVGAQPKSDEETLRGALHRALSLPSGDWFRLGLEGGVTRQEGRLFLINYGALIAPSGKEYLAGGARIVLPSAMEKPLYEEGKELSTVMGDFYDLARVRSGEGAIGIFTHGLVTRPELFVHIIKLLYGSYLYDSDKETSKP